MKSRPVIGIACQTQEPIAGETPWAWVMGQRYVKVLTRSGAVPWLIPLVYEDEATLRAIYDRLDGIFLTGGVDVDPNSYGESRQSVCGRIDVARDKTELQLIQWSIVEHKPVLGVCRGLQVINVAGGGTLYQDIAHDLPHSMKHDYFPSQGGYRRDQIVHSISVDTKTRLGRILDSPEVPVNSMHHQSIKTLAAGLVTSALAPDGVIEAIEGANGQFLVGVQWHPEELADHQPGMQRLFDEFLLHARQFPSSC